MGWIRDNIFFKKNIQVTWKVVIVKLVGFYFLDLDHVLPEGAAMQFGGTCTQKRISGFLD